MQSSPDGRKVHFEAKVEDSERLKKLRREEREVGKGRREEGSKGLRRWRSSVVGGGTVSGDEDSRHNQENLGGRQGAARGAIRKRSYSFSDGGGEGRGGGHIKHPSLPPAKR